MKLQQPLSLNKHALPLLLYLFLGIFFFYRFFFLGEVFIPQAQIHAPLHNPYLSDVADQYMPNNIVLAAALKNGEAPLWNPYALGGYPLLANPTVGAAYPVKLLFYSFFSPETAHGINLFCHLVFMGVAMYFFTLQISFSQPAAFLSGLIWMFNGSTMVWLEFEYAPIIAGWLALLFWFTEKYFKERSPCYLLFGGGAIGMMMVAGMPQLAIYATTLFIFYFLFRQPLSYRTVLLLFFPLAVGALTAAVQIIPTMELLSLSQRPTLSYDYITTLAGVFPVENFITFFIPDFFGNPVDGYYFSPGALLNDAQNYVELSGYTGLLPAFLALIAVFFTKDRIARFFVIAFIISLLAAMGTPVYYLFYRLIPGFSKLKAISRIIFINSFCISLLAGIGADFLFFRASAAKKRFLALFFIALSFLFPACLFFGKIFLINIFAHEAASFPSLSLQTHFSLGNHAFYLPIFLLFGCAFFFSLSSFFSDKPSWRVSSWRGAIPLLTLLVSLLIVIDLFSFGWKFNTTTDKEKLYPPLPAAALLKKDTDLFRIMPVGLPPNLFMPYGIQAADGYNNLYPKLFSDFAELIENKKDKEIKHYVYYSKPYLTPLVNLLNIKYLLISPDLPYRLQEENLIPSPFLRIYKNPDVLPRAFMVHKVKYFKTEEEILQEMSKQSFNPTSELLLTKNNSSAVPALFPVLASKKSTAVEKVSMLQYSPSSIILDVQTARDGFLFLTDTYYPGWRASIDGIETEVLRANYAFRAAFVPKESHTVTFTYQPVSFRVGLIISLICYFLFLFAGIKKTIMNFS